MKYQGHAPKVVLSEGIIVSEITGETFISCYDWEASPPVIRIGQAGLIKMWNHLQRTDIPDEISVLIAAAEETAHFVQDMQDRLPHTGNKSSIYEPEHYDEDCETEARLISMKIVNRILGYQFWSDS